MADAPSPSDQAGNEAITEDQQPQKKGKLTGILPMILGVAIMAGLTWAFTQFVLVRTIEDSLKGVLVESSAEGGSEEKTANGGEPSEDDTHGSSDNHASDGSADHSNASDNHASSSDGHGGSGKPEEEEKLENPYQIESALVNIKSTNASRFLVVSITIDSGQDDQRRLALYNILKAKDAFVRDMTLEILSEFSMEDLSDEPAAKNKVKIQLKERLSQYITDKNLNYSVLFTQWAIQ